MFAWMTHKDLCPHCGQRMLMRHGAHLSPRLADIFDMVEHSGKRGITREHIACVFYPGMSLPAAKNLISVSINHINDMLGSTGVQVRMADRAGPYRVLHNAK